MKDIQSDFYKIFEGFLEDNKISTLLNEYNNVKDLPLQQIGIDSLSLMGIVINISNFYQLEIDFEKFNIEDINSLDKINKYINSNVKR